jgi:molybdenum cofactor cytidylyltransferase
LNGLEAKQGMKYKRPKIAVAILAAGSASRFGDVKQLADWFGLPMLQSIINTVTSTGVKPFVMLGAHADKIITSTEADLSLCNVVMVDGWQEGMSAAIRVFAGKVRELNTGQDKKYDGVLILLGDQPLLEESDLRVLFDRIQTSSGRAVCCRYANGVGVPVYFPAAMLGELSGLSGKKGAKALIESIDHDSIALACSLTDVDSQSDLVRARALYNKKAC